MFLYYQNSISSLSARIQFQNRYIFFFSHHSSQQYLSCTSLPFLNISTTSIETKQNNTLIRVNQKNILLQVYLNFISLYVYVFVCYVQILCKARIWLHIAFRIKYKQCLKIKECCCLPWLDHIVPAHLSKCVISCNSHPYFCYVCVV